MDNGMRREEMMDFVSVFLFVKGGVDHVVSPKPTPHTTPHTTCLPEAHTKEARAFLMLPDDPIPPFPTSSLL